jgi:hypothetical protein
MPSIQHITAQHVCPPTENPKSFILDSAHHRSNVHSRECGKKNSLPLIKHITCNVLFRKHFVQHPASSIQRNAEAKHHLSDVGQRTQYHWISTSLSQHAFSWIPCPTLCILDQIHHRSNIPSRKWKAKNAISRSSTSLAISQIANSVLDFLHHQSNPPPKRSIISQMKDKELSVVDLTHHSRNIPSRRHFVQMFCIVNQLPHRSGAISLRYGTKNNMPLIQHVTSNMLSRRLCAQPPSLIDLVNHRSEITSLKQRTENSQSLFQHITWVKRLFPNVRLSEMYLPSDEPPKWHIFFPEHNKERYVRDPTHHKCNVLFLNIQSVNNTLQIGEPPK